jgi:hypothetical protein
VTDGTESLASLEGDVDRLRIAQRMNVKPAIDELLALDRPMSRTVCLSGWAIAYPRATSQLLTVVARDPRLATELAQTVLGWIPMMGTNHPELDSIDEILIAAFPALQGPWRDAAAERPDVRAAHTLADFEPLPPPEPGWQWPTGQPFPPADEVDGMQARLNFFGYGAGPVTGEWSPLTRRALERWQIHMGLEPTGELDDDTVDQLKLDTPSPAS